VAELRLTGYFELDVNEENKRLEVVPCFNPPLRLLANVPPAPAAHPYMSPWRRIEVHVAPHEVQAFCDGFPMGGYAIADVKRRNARTWRDAHATAYPHAAFPFPDFPSRGGLGLYVVNGPANFRNVVVEPLDQP
jgi:hypothetical protein